MYHTLSNSSADASSGPRQVTGRSPPISTAHFFQEYLFAVIPDFLAPHRNGLTPICQTLAMVANSAATFDGTGTPAGAMFAFSPNTKTVVVAKYLTAIRGE